MSLLATIFDARGIGDSHKLLANIESALEAEGDVQVHKHCDRNFAAINIVKPFAFAPKQPFHSGDACLLLDGAFFDDRPMNELVRILFSCNPVDLATLNGQFNAAIFRKLENELVIVTDRLGTRPLYHALVGGRHVISSAIKGIRGSVNGSFDLSAIGLIELFAFGHNVGDRTVLDAVNVLPPGSVIRINENGIQIVKYYEYCYRDTHQRLTSREWGERISACVKAVVPKYYLESSRPSVFLSGGLDSRLVAGAIGDSTQGVHAYTFGDPISRDALFAQDLASRIGLQHQILTYPDSYLSDSILDIVTRTECAAPFYHATSIVFHDSIALETDTILVGFCGDALSGAHLKRGMLKPIRQTCIAEQVFQRALCSNRSDIERVFQPTFFKQYWAATVDVFHSSVKNIEAAHSADVADIWDMQNRQRRFTFSSPKVDRRRFEVVAPLLDNQFVDLMTCLPVDARWKQLAYRHAIIDGFPDIRSVRWTRTGRQVPAGQALLLIEEARRIGSKLYLRTLDKVGLANGKQEDQYKHISDDIRRDNRLLSEYLDRPLARGTLPEDIFNVNGIRELVQGHLGGKDYSHLLGMIMTVVAYLESNTA